MFRRRLTKLQVKLYMDSRLKTKTRIAAAARADISVSSAYRIEKGKISGDKKKRSWKTRKDPFEEVWSSIILPQVESHPNLLAITILEKLQDDFPNKYPDRLLRTLQRRIKAWKVMCGPQKVVIFNQEHYPGRLGISDFTILKGIMITIQGQIFDHILYHFRLVYSRWSFLKVVQGGESCSALLEGLQEALWRLGGSPKEHRTDSLSAAFKNLTQEAIADTTQKYNEFCAHYKMIPSRNNKGVSHENGSIESPHGHIKRRIAQALILRGSNDFDSVAAYQSWLDAVVASHNKRNAKEVDFERESLQKLPLYKTTDFTEAVVRVHGSSTVAIKGVTYSVPSRLSGEILRAHIYQDRIELYFGSDNVFTMNRVYSQDRKKKIRVIDYRHIIHSLYKKPQAFRYSQIKAGILPNDKFRSIWDYVNKNMDAKLACKFIVSALYIAHKYDCEDDVADHIMDNIKQNKPLSTTALEQRYRKVDAVLPDIIVSQHALQEYDQILENHNE